MLAITLLTAWAAAAPLPEARLDRDAPPTERELDANARLERRACPSVLSVVPVGLGRFCSRRPVEGAVMSAQIAGNLALIGAFYDAPVSGSAGIGLQTVMFQSVSADIVDGWLNHHRRYAPPETLGELAFAPFNVEVLRKPGVWVVAGVGTAAAVTVSVVALESGGADVDWFGAKPNLFGAALPPAIGVPAGTVLNAQMMLNVAMGEEYLFRGVVQGAGSRALGKPGGLVLSSVLFWSVHIPNWLTGPREDWGRDVAIGSAFVGTLGVAMGTVHQAYGYRLSHPVAIHFWYNLLIQTTAFAADPEHGTWSARVTLPL